MPKRNGRRPFFFIFPPDGKDAPLCTPPFSTLTRTWSRTEVEFLLPPPPLSFLGTFYPFTAYISPLEEDEGRVPFPLSFFFLLNGINLPLFSPFFFSFRPPLLSRKGGDFPFLPPSFFSIQGWEEAGFLLLSYSHPGTMRDERLPSLLLLFSLE